MSFRSVLLGVATFLFSETGLRAELQFSTPQVDAGEVKSGAPLRKPFVFQNSGPDAVDILEVRSSCGCLTPKLDQRHYAPGETGAILMEVNTLGQAAGAHTWSAHVTYRFGQTIEERTLQMSARVVREVMVEPAALTIYAGNAVHHDIRVTDRRPKAFSIRQVVSSSEHVKPRLTDLQRDQDGHVVQTIRLEIAADCPDGRHDDALTIHTDDLEYAELRVPVTILKRAQKSLTALPNLVNLNVAAGQPVPSRIILVKDGSDRPVVVDRVEADHPAVRCQHARGPGAMSTVKIQIDRQRIEAAVLNATISIHTSQPTPQVLTVPVTCKVD